MDAMSYGNSFDPRFDGFPPDRPARGPGLGGLGLGFLIACAMMIAAGAYLFPVLHKQWNDAEFKEREIIARAEADALFRKREAELKAMAQAAGEHLTKVEAAPSTFRLVAEKAGPAVVNITNYVFVNNGLQPTLEGSGVLWKLEDDADGLKAGYVITNSHVVRGPNRSPEVTDRLGITFASGRTVYVEGKSGNIYHDPLFDLAVIKVDVSDLDHLVTADFADSDNVAVGDWVLAIGSPFGLKQSVTQGIISAKGRTELHDLIQAEVLQTDAAINQGNSGGPLIDMQGRVVGINVAIATLSGGSNGIGFAIPSNKAKEVLETLLRPPHRIIRGYLGVQPMDLDRRAALRINVDGGAVIAGVQQGTPADAAGLAPGDIIIAGRYQGKRRNITSAADLRAFIREVKPDEKVDLEVVRGLGQRGRQPERITFEVTVAELDFQAMQSNQPRPDNPRQFPQRGQPPGQPQRRVPR
jgi:S1-C subfamily serine protease